jgi:hypothetical protein
MRAGSWGATGFGANVWAAPRGDNASIREDGDAGEWQDWLVDETASQESRLVADEHADNRRKALTDG